MAMWAIVALICLGIADIGAAAGSQSSSSLPTSRKNSDRLMVPPILEELCARLAAFGLVEPMGMEPQSAPRRECRPLLLSVGQRDAPEPTSIFTTVRAESDSTAALSVRFKINALEPRTRDRAVSLVQRALRSILRGYDLEMPEELAVAIEKLEDGRYSLGPVRFDIRTEREDARRHNIFLSIQGNETQGMTSGGPAFLPLREPKRAFDGLS